MRSARREHGQSGEAQNHRILSDLHPHACFNHVPFLSLISIASQAVLFLYSDFMCADLPFRICAFKKDSRKKYRTYPVRFFQQYPITLHISVPPERKSRPECCQKKMSTLSYHSGANATPKWNASWRDDEDDKDLQRKRCEI